MTHCVSFKKVSVLYNIYCILIICGVVIPCMAFIMVRIIGGKSPYISLKYSVWKEFCMYIWDTERGTQS